MASERAAGGQARPAHQEERQARSREGQGRLQHGLPVDQRAHDEGLHSTCYLSFCVFPLFVPLSFSSVVLLAYTFAPLCVSYLRMKASFVL